ncbi:MAG: PilZ domain-containing protein, partial [Blastocatellia bacterium]
MGKTNMHDPKLNKNSNGSTHSAVGKSSSTLEADRRSANRQMFTATAEVVEFLSGARFSTRTMDLGPGGCFVDTTNPFPVGSKVHVKLSNAKSSFETSGLVVYSQHGLGMGISFTNLSADQEVALTAWLSGRTGDREAAPEMPAKPRNTAPNQGPDRATIVRLVRMLIGKGLLTESEGTSV